MAYFAHLLALFLLFIDVGTSYLYYREPELADSTCPGTQSTLLPWVGTPSLVRNTTNGSLYTAGEGDDQLFGRK